MVKTKPPKLTLLLTTLVVAGLPFAAHAVATSRGFRTTQSLADGSLVSLDSDNGQEVVAATPDNVSKLVGVVVDPTSSTLEFSDPGQNVQVAQGGTVSALVSDLNGTIKTGDHITASPISGVGMKETDSGVVVGTAQANFDPKRAITQELKTKSGKTTDVHLEQINLILNIGAYTPPVSSQSGYIPSQLQQLADSITGHPTAPWRIVVSLLILTVTLVTLATFTYSSVHSSLVAIGRNPLSSPAIAQSLFQLVVLGLGALFIALFAMYVILAF